MSTTTVTRARDAIADFFQDDTDSAVLGEHDRLAARRALGNVPTIALPTIPPARLFGEQDDLQVKHLVQTVATIADRYSEALNRIEALEKQVRQHNRDVEALRRIFGTAVA